MSIGPHLNVSVLWLIVIAVVVIAIVKGGRTARWVVAVTVVLVSLLVLAIALPSVARRRQAATQQTVMLRERAEDEMVARIAEAGRAPRTLPSPASGAESAFRAAEEVASTYARIQDAQARAQAERQDWTPSADHPFQANLYPSQRSAVIALTRQIMGDSLNHVLPPNAILTRARVTGNLDAALLREAAKEVQEILEIRHTLRSRRGEIERGHIQDDLQRLAIESGATPAAVTQPAEEREPGLIALHFNLLQEASLDADLSQTGEIEAILSGVGGAVSHHTAYVNASWSEEYDKWLGYHSRPTWARATSEQLCATREDARDQAMVQAALEVGQRLKDYISDQGGRYGSPLVSSEWLADRILSDLRRGTIRVAKFDQEFRRPYGSVYRCAVLADASPEALERLADTYYRQVEQQRERFLTVGASCAGVVLLTLVVYLFLNAATKGYYVWSMRIAGIALAAGGVLAVLVLA